MYGSWNMVCNGQMDGESDTERLVPHLEKINISKRVQLSLEWKNREL